MIQLDVPDCFDEIIVLHVKKSVNIFPYVDGGGIHVSGGDRRRERPNREVNAHAPSQAVQTKSSRTMG